MSLSKPYPNIYRHGPPSVIEPYLEQRRSPEGINCLAVYELLRKDLRIVFEYIEPTEKNFETFSHRTYEMLLRACTEVEALSKQVFDKNHVNLGSQANIIRYSDLSGPMRLHEYEIFCYGFEYPSFYPFKAFDEKDRRQRSPHWYQAYNAVKHNRSSEFKHANLGNVIQAIGGVYTLLIAQFGPGFDSVMQMSPIGYPISVPDIFQVRKLPDWPEEEQYSFDWTKLKEDVDRYRFHELKEIP